MPQMLFIELIILKPWALLSTCTERKIFVENKVLRSFLFFLSWTSVQSYFYRLVNSNLKVFRSSKVSRNAKAHVNKAASKLTDFDGPLPLSLWVCARAVLKGGGEGEGLERPAGVRESFFCAPLPTTHFKLTSLASPALPPGAPSELPTTGQCSIRGISLHSSVQSPDGSSGVIEV